jgi:phage baseplate assembly protein W
MGSITFNNLKPVSKNVQRYTYADLFLDIQEEPMGISGNYLPVRGSGRDIKVAYDFNAIRNSIYNLFNTIPGERILLPDYGSDLRRYIFEPVTDLRGTLIGREIYTAITRWEPRVTVINIDVVGHIDAQEYDITIVLQTPFIPKTEYLKGILNKEGYVIA